MALIKCPDCGQEISEKAVSCRHCGLPNPASHIKPPPPPPPKKKLKIDLILQASGGAFLLAGLVCMATGHSGYSLAAFIGGLFLAALGGIWGWISKE